MCLRWLAGAPAAEKHYQKAVELYSEALTINPTNSVLYSNRECSPRRVCLQCWLAALCPLGASIV